MLKIICLETKLAGKDYDDTPQGVRVQANILAVINDFMPVFKPFFKKIAGNVITCTRMSKNATVRETHLGIHNKVFVVDTKTTVILIQKVVSLIRSPLIKYLKSPLLEPKFYTAQIEDSCFILLGN